MRSDNELSVLSCWIPLRVWNTWFCLGQLKVISCPEVMGSAEVTVCSEVKAFSGVISDDRGELEVKARFGFLGELDVSGAREVMGEVEDMKVGEEVTSSPDFSQSPKVKAAWSGLVCDVTVLEQ